MTISLDIITFLLENVKKQYKDFFHVAMNMVERIFKKCADMIKPYLSPFIKNFEICFDDYSAIVSSLWQRKVLKSVLSPIVITHIVHTLNTNIIGELPIALSLKSTFHVTSWQNWYCLLFYVSHWLCVYITSKEWYSPSGLIFIQRNYPLANFSLQ